MLLVIPYFCDFPPVSHWFLYINYLLQATGSFCFQSHRLLNNVTGGSMVPVDFTVVSHWFLLSLTVSLCFRSYELVVYLWNILASRRYLLFSRVWTVCSFKKVSCWTLLAFVFTIASHWFHSRNGTVFSVLVVWYTNTLSGLMLINPSNELTDWWSVTQDL